MSREWPRQDRKPKQMLLIQEARGLMATVMTDAGISVDNYMAIANAAQPDSALRKRIETAVGATC
jgi:hypothetical protein